MTSGIRQRHPRVSIPASQGTSRGAAIGRSAWKQPGSPPRRCGFSLARSRPVACRRPGGSVVQPMEPRCDALPAGTFRFLRQGGAPVWCGGSILVR